MANYYAVKVESCRAGKDGKPSVGPVYRNSLAKDGFPALPPQMTTSWDVFRLAVNKYPDNKMLGWREIKDEQIGPYLWKTYKEVYEEVVRVGSALKLTIRPGSRVGIYGVNCPQWMVAMEACNGYGFFVCVPLYDTLGAGAADFIIEHAEIDVVFVQPKKIKEVLSANCRSAKRIKAMVSFACASTDQAQASAQLGVKMYSWNDFLRMGKENESDPIPPRAQDICTIMYTSGTSGDPKGVVLTHECIAALVHGVDLYIAQFEDKMTSDDAYLSFLPLAHILDRILEEYFFHHGASVGYFHGNSVVDLMKDIQAVREDLVELKPTLFAGVPRVFERVHEGVLKAVAELRPLRRIIFRVLYKWKLKRMMSGHSHKTASELADFLAFREVKERLGGRVRLIISGGAPLSAEIEEFLRVATCAHVTQGYGLTETCGLTAVGYPDDMSLVGTVGVPSTYTELRLEQVAEMGYDPLGNPSRGEICVRGKTLFSGYYKNPELTQQVLVDGWFHTGDVGEMSPDGVLKVIDRKKNIFKLSQGEYVAVEYLEKVYSVTALVEDIWVYGDSLRSMLVAVIVPQEDNTRRWAESNGFKHSSFSEICELEQLRRYVLQELKTVAENNKLRGFEYIKGVVVDPQPFDTHRNLVTPTMKKKRGQMLNYYQRDIDKLYKSLSDERTGESAAALDSASC